MAYSSSDPSSDRRHAELSRLKTELRLSKQKSEDLQVEVKLSVWFLWLYIFFVCMDQTSTALPIWISNVMLIFSFLKHFSSCVEFIWCKFKKAWPTVKLNKNTEALLLFFFVILLFLKFWPKWLPLNKLPKAVVVIG